MDVTEWWWLPPRKGMPPSFLPLVLEHLVRYRFTYARPRRLITATRALDDFYRARGCDTLILPPLLDLREERWRVTKRAEQNGAMHILFAGSPDRERWDVILRGLLSVNQLGIPISLHVLGVARDRFERVLGHNRHLLKHCAAHVVFHGRLPFEKVTHVIASAHLGLLVRDDAPWSRGCFPSKVPETLALGVPILFNPSSDLDEYLKDGVEGIRINAPTVECFADGLKRAWTLLQNGCWEDLRRAARNRAHASFDLQVYANSLRDFLGF